jgi:predicted enzyme related to lactoylglutathione lyase
MNLEKMDFGSEKMACFPGDEGAITYAPGYKPSKDGLIVSFNVSDNLEDTISRIKANGGEIVQPKTKIEAESRGYFAIFIDCEGNKVGLYGND